MIKPMKMILCVAVCTLLLHTSSAFAQPANDDVSTKDAAPTSPTQTDKAEEQEPEESTTPPETDDNATADDQAAPPIESLDDEQLIAKLGSEHYDDRRRAHELLLKRDDFNEHAERYFKLAENLEAQKRLISLAHHHFLREFRIKHMDTVGPAAVGVSHLLAPPGTMPGQTRPAVHVTRTVPGFPGHTHLRVDDMILSVNGMPMPENAASDTFGDIVQQMTAGEQITFEVLRDGKVIKRTMTLASSRALRGMFPYPGDRLQVLEMVEQRWQQRLRQLKRDIKLPKQLAPEK
ncbi:MAG: PDZ domain-containing protein [Firmicutes bacterium]|nr:PDZ domain-containing protein [Bacillota bacterium]